MTTQPPREQPQADQPRELAERVAILEGEGRSIPQHLDALRQDTTTLRTETRDDAAALRLEVNAVNSRIDRLSLALVIGSISLAVTAVAAIATFIVTIITAFAD